MIECSDSNHKIRMPILKAFSRDSSENATPFIVASISIVEVFKKGINAKDALHISCAIYSNCEYFITTDKKLLNKNNNIEGIKILNPIEFVNEMEGD